MWNLQFYPTTVLNERMWLLGIKHTLIPPTYFQGGGSGPPNLPWSTPLLTHCVLHTLHQPPNPRQALTAHRNPLSSPATLTFDVYGSMYSVSSRIYAKLVDLSFNPCWFIRYNVTQTDRQTDRRTESTANQYIRGTPWTYETRKFWDEQLTIE